MSMNWSMVAGQHQVSHQHFAVAGSRRITLDELKSLSWIAPCGRRASTAVALPPASFTPRSSPLIAKAASDSEARPILAGRNLDKVKRVAEPLGLSARAFDLKREA
jgi:hypothetical protein